VSGYQGDQGFVHNAGDEGHGGHGAAAGVAAFGGILCRGFDQQIPVLDEDLDAVHQWKPQGSQYPAVFLANLTDKADRLGPLRGMVDVLDHEIEKFPAAACQKLPGLLRQRTFRQSGVHVLPGSLPVIDGRLLQVVCNPQ